MSRILPSRLVAGLLVLAAAASAQCYQFSGPGVSLQINVARIDLQLGPSFISGNYSTTYTYSGTNTFTLAGVGQSSQSIMDGTANLQYLAPPLDTTTFQMVVPNGDPPGSGSHLWEVMLAATGNLIPSGLLPTPGAIPPISSWVLQGGNNVPGTTYNYINVHSGASRTKYLVTDVRACSQGGGGGGGTGPIITKVTNNSSDVPAGFPNSGISQGALFKIIGTDLADGGDATLHDSSAPGGLPFTLNGAKATVTVGSTVVNIPLYYATPTQIDGVLPANTPTGAGTVIVTHNGVASNAYPIQVVGAAPGITTYNNGTAVAQDTSRPTDPYGGLITFTKSAAPGAVIVIWGSGFGATSDGDAAYTGSPHTTAVPYSIYIGGVQVTNLAYAGRSVYPGVSVFVLTIPQNAPQGCFVPVVAISTVNGISTASNSATLPIHAGGGTCSDAQYGTTGDLLTNLTGKTTVKTGTISVIQSTTPGSGGASTTSSLAAASFLQTSGASYGGGLMVSVGGCIVIPAAGAPFSGSTTGLDAGTITATPASGSPVTLTTSPLTPGIYSASLSSPLSSVYEFRSAGGTQVGTFDAMVNFPGAPLAWTNQNAAMAVNRSAGLTVNWTGGFASTFVTITGTSSTTTSAGTVSGSYVCVAPGSAGQFTVPSYILRSLPAGTGSTSITNATMPSYFSASGIDLGLSFGQVSISATSSYN